MNGEHRLLCAILEGAIGGYLANMECSTGRQRDAFREVCDWFLPASEDACSPVAFQALCDLLDIPPSSTFFALNRHHEHFIQRAKQSGRVTTIGKRNSHLVCFSMKVLSGM